MMTRCFRSFITFSLLLALTSTLDAEDGDSRQARLVINTEGIRGSWVRALDISNDRQWLAAADGETVRIWRISDQRLWSTLRGYSEGAGLQTGTINTLAFSKDSQFLVVGVSDNTKLGSTRVYALRSPDRIHRLLDGHSGCTSGVAFSKDGKYLATWSCDGTAIVSHWNASEGSSEPIIKVDIWADSRTVSTLPFSYFGFPYDNNWLVHANGNSVQIISMRERRALQDFDDAPAVLRDIFLENGKQPFLSPVTGSTLSLDILNRVCPECGAAAAAREAARRTSTTPVEQLLDVGGIRIGSDTLVAMGGSTKRLKDTSSLYWIGIWSKDRRIPLGQYSGHRFFPTAVSVNQANGLVASADALGEIHLWDFDTQQKRHVIRSHTQPIYRVHWSDDNDGIYFSNENHSQSNYVHNAYGPITHQFMMKSRHVQLAQASLSEEYFPKLRDVHGRVVAELKSAPGSGELILTSLGNKDDLEEKTKFTLKDYKLELEGDSPTAYAFLPQSNVAFDQAPYICGTKRGHLFQLGLDYEGRLVVKREFIGHDSTITSVSFSPDGNRMVSGGFDGTIRFWNLDEPRVLGDLDAQMYGNMVVDALAGSKSARAGLRAGDKIMFFGNHTYYERIREYFTGKYAPAQRVRVAWQRSAARTPTLLDTSGVSDPDQEDMSEMIELIASPDRVEPLLVLFVTKDGEWVLWDPKGHYDSSPQGERFIGWHVNRERHEPADFYGANQYRDQLYRPRTIDEDLRTIGFEVPVPLLPDVASDDPVRPAPPAKEDIDLRTDLVSPPQTKFVKPDSLASTAQNEIDVEAEISSPFDHSVKEVIFRVNGRQSPQNYSLLHSERADQRTTMRVRQRLKLDQGTNEIELIARHDLATSSTSRLLIECKAITEMKSVVLPNLYVLSIGVSKYANPSLSLEYADRDAAEFVAACEEMKVTCTVRSNVNY